MSTYEGGARGVVDPEEAARHGLAAARALAGDATFGTVGWERVEVDPRPLEIRDVNGAPLFFDFDLGLGDEVVGHVRTAASRILGAPVVSVETRPRRWDPFGAARRIVRRLEAEPHDVTVDLVCYAYPKIGIRVHGADDDEAIYDAASLDPVHLEPRDEHDHFAAWSFFEEHPHRLERDERGPGEYERMVEQIERVQTIPRPLLAVANFVYLSPACRTSLGVPHYAQITNYNCVPASAQMIFDHYGWNYDQQAIATAMGTSQQQGGTTQQGLENGLTSLLLNTMEYAFDWSTPRNQQLADAVAEIDANRPLFTQVPHHYRVCVGYFRLFGAMLLAIYDPWPWSTDLCGGGAQYLESWATSPIMWFGMLRHRSTPCL